MALMAERIREMAGVTGAKGPVTLPSEAVARAGIPVTAVLEDAGFADPAIPDLAAVAAAAQAGRRPAGCFMAAAAAASAFLAKARTGPWVLSAAPQKMVVAGVPAEQRVVMAGLHVSGAADR